MIQTSYNFGIGRSVNSDLVINDSISNNSINNTASDNIITLFTNPDNFLDDSGNRLNEIYFFNTNYKFMGGKFILVDTPPQQITISQQQTIITQDISNNGNRNSR